MNKKSRFGLWETQGRVPHWLPPRHDSGRAFNVTAPSSCAHDLARHTTAHPRNGPLTTFRASDILGAQVRVTRAVAARTQA